VLASSIAAGQSPADSAAGQAIALTPASTFVAMNPAVFGDSLRAAADLNYAHKPQWRTSGLSLNTGAFRVQAGRGHFDYAPREDEYFVGLDYARALLYQRLMPHVSFVLGADVSLGYGSENVGGGNGNVGETTGGFISAGLRSRFGNLTVIPFFAPGYFSGRYTRVRGGITSSVAGKRITQGGGVRLELDDRFTIDFGVRKTRLSGAIPRYGMAVGLNALPLRRDALPNVRNLRLEMDNDFFTFKIPPRRRPDDDYTNGVRLSFDRADPARSLSFLTSNRTACGALSVAGPCAAARIEIGQEIYTPTDDSFLNLKFDRPYAGWLYASYSGHVLTSREDRSTTFAGGVVGPQSLAEKTQKAFHALFPWYRAPNGWTSQLTFEPGFLATTARRYLVGGSGTHANYFQLIPEWKISLGNVLTGGSAGAVARVGYKVPAPWNSSSSNRSSFGAYAFAGIREDLVLHNIFLDGNTFRGRAQVKRNPLVWQRQAGMGLRIGFLAAEYRAVLRQREYQVKNEDLCSALGCPMPSAFPIASILHIPKSHPYGTLSVTIGRSF
jgi:Uncharacterized protein conserved in bacteria